MRARVIFHRELRADSSELARVIERWIKWPAARNEAMHLSAPMLSAAVTTRGDASNDRPENCEREGMKKRGKIASTQRDVR